MRIDTDDPEAVRAHLREIALRQATSTCNRGMGRAIGNDDLAQALVDREIAIVWHSHLLRLLDGDVANLLQDLVLAQVCTFSDLRDRASELDVPDMVLMPWFERMASWEHPSR